MSDTTPTPDETYRDGKSLNFDPDPNDVDTSGVTPGSGENIGGDAVDTDTDIPDSVITPGDQVATDNGGTVPDTTPTEPVAGEPADTTTGSVEGGDTVAGSGPGVAEADPEAPAAPESEVIAEGEVEPAEPTDEGPVTAPEPDVQDAGEAPAAEEAPGEVVAEPEPDVIEDGTVVEEPVPAVENAEPEVVDADDFVPDVITVPEDVLDGITGPHPVEEPVPDVVDEDVVPVPAAADSDGDEHHVWTIWSRKRKAWFNVVEDEGIVAEPNGYRLKSSAKEEGREEARSRGVIHFIQKKNGEVGEENSYGYRAKHELD